MIALVMIREFNGWTVRQTHEASLFWADIQYALNLLLVQCRVPQSKWRWSWSPIGSRPTLGF